MFDKNQVKENLLTSNIEELLSYWNANPRVFRDGLIARTVCHGGEKHKLYYYADNQMFHCYSGCQPASFDIFDLVRKVEGIDNLNDAVEWVVNYFGLWNLDSGYKHEQDDGWDVFKNYKPKPREEPVERLPIYNPNVLRGLPVARPQSWLDEGIAANAIEKCGCKFDPLSYGVIIPHYDIDCDLCGIRKRTLIKDEEKYGKYVPWVHNGVMYSHPLALNLYNLNMTKQMIHDIGIAIVVEAEKSAIKSYGWFGPQSIVVACCGSSLSNTQFSLLMDLGIRELVIAFDHDFVDRGSEEYINCKRKITKVAQKFSPYVTTSVIFDEYGTLGYKESPLDQTKDVFVNLFNRRYRI